MGTLTRDRLRELLSYDAETGIFRWKATTTNRVKAGTQAGFNANGYILIGIDGRKYQAHRLAFLYMTGSLPSDEVDHRNGVRDDNRFSNLRLVSHEENMQNEQRPRKNNTSGFLGVYWQASAKAFRARISIKGKGVHLGYFKSAEDAHKSYLAAKRALHGGNTL